MLQAIHVVDPETLQVEKTLTSDQNGNSLTNAQNKSRTWNDVAFVEVYICPCCQFLMHACMHTAHQLQLSLKHDCDEIAYHQQGPIKG